MIFTNLCRFTLFLSFSASAAALPLEQKLEQQWAQYQAAQDFLIGRLSRTEMPLNERLVSRPEWENLVSLKGEFAFNDKDIASLRSSQRSRIDHAKITARRASPIDLNRFRRSAESVRSFCEQIPKGGMLHIHPSGTYDRDTVAELFGRKQAAIGLKSILDDIDNSNGIALLYPHEKEALKVFPDTFFYAQLSGTEQLQLQEFLFLPPGKHPFPRFQSLFNFTDLVEENLDFYETALQNFASKAARLGVSYVEFTTGGTGADIQEIFARVEKNSGVMIRQNVSFYRLNEPAALEQRVNSLLAQAPNPRIVGIDFLANEDGNPALEKGQIVYGSVLKEVKTGRSALHRTMHAGEIGDPRNPRDAMILGAERLGHGVLLNDDPVALEFAAIKKIPVEVNLASNLRLTKVESIETHPFLDYLRLGLPISLSTDDEGMFDTDIANECVLAVMNSDVSYNELKQMALNSIATSFASDGDKAILRAKIETSFDQFEGSRQLSRWKARSRRSAQLNHAK